MKVYHCTDNDFERFDDDYMDSNELSQQLGSGFYFSKNLQNAMQYGSRILVCEIPDGDYFPRYFSEEVERDIIIKMLKASPKLEKCLLNFGEIAYEGFDKVFNRAIDSYEGLRYDQFVIEFANDFYPDNPVLFNCKLKELTGYIGVCDTDVYCVFLAEDIKITGEN